MLLISSVSWPSMFNAPCGETLSADSDQLRECVKIPGSRVPPDFVVCKCLCKLRCLRRTNVVIRYGERCEEETLCRSCQTFMYSSTRKCVYSSCSVQKAIAGICSSEAQDTLGYGLQI